jgi:hypothetical protein
MTTVRRPVALMLNVAHAIDRAVARGDPQLTLAGASAPRTGDRAC